MNCIVPSAGNDIPLDLNLTIYCGGTFLINVTWTDESETPINLTGYTAVMKVKNGTTTVVDLDTTNGGIVLGGPAGSIQLNLDVEATEALEPQNCVYDLILTSSGNIAYPLLAGLVNIRQGVSVD